MMEPEPVEAIGPPDHTRMPMIDLSNSSLEALWCAAPAQFSIHPDEVHVWRAGLDVAASVLRDLQATLAADEQARAARFCSAVDRERYAAGRGILRTLLGRYLGVAPGELRFRYNHQGKPALAPGSAGQDLRFNISHSQGLALFAFALGRDLGVDLEYVQPSLRSDELAERFFSAQEIAALRSFPQNAQTEMFFHCWTRKEAYIKARGEGLDIGLDSFSVSLESGGSDNPSIVSDVCTDARRWSLRPLAPDKGYVGAVAVEGAGWSLALWQWP